MSAAGESVASYSDSNDSIDTLVQKIFQILSKETISSNEHIKAVDLLGQLHSTLASNQGVASSRRSQVLLICTLTSIGRRLTRLRELLARTIHIGGTQSPAEVLAETDDFSTTQTLVFIVIVQLDILARDGLAADGEEAFSNIDEAHSRSLWAQLAKKPKRRRELPDDLQENQRQRLLLDDLVDQPFVTSESSSSWDATIFQPGNLANFAVKAAGSVLQNGSTIDLSSELGELATVFARSTAAQMAVQMLFNPRDFGSLTSMRIGQLPLSDREDALRSIVSAAESEAGQAVLRDFMISFLLPQKIIGVRRTLLMDRGLAASVSKNFPWIAACAHEVAMAGSESAFGSQCELKRVCALLTGVGLLLTTETDDPIRKARAFRGLVQLPFLETTPPERKNQQRLALVTTNRSWVLYSLSKKGIPVVELSQRGFEGLLNACLVFRNSF